MRDLKDKTLRGCSLFAGLDHAARQKVARAGEVVDRRDGEVLQHAGERMACWWLVLDGVVLLDGDEGAAVVAAGDGWGADDALGRRPTSRSAVAVTDVRCLVVARPRLESLLLEVPELSVALLRRDRLGR